MQQTLILCLLMFLSTLICHAANFNSPRTFSLPTSQGASASGDLNNDGFPDLITGGSPGDTTSNIGKIYVMLGKGNGNFQPPQEYRVGYRVGEEYWSPRVEEIKVADLDNDSKLDVVVIHNHRATFSRTNVYTTVLFGNGDGTLQTAEGYAFDDSASYNFVSSLDLADMDSDGLMDIIFTVYNNGGAGYLYILRNTGNRNFNTAARIGIPAEPFGVSAVNLNNDQYLDYVLATRDGIFICRSDNRFFPTNVEIRDEGLIESGLVVKDLNNDGRADIALSTLVISQLRVFINTPNGFPVSPVIYNLDSPASEVKSGDLNGDGSLDLLVNSNKGFRVFYNAGNGTFNDSDFIEGYTGGFEIKDLNSDGKLDIINANGSIRVYLNSPNNTRYHTDFNGDLNSDFTVYRPGTGVWWTLFNGGNNPAPYRAVQFGISTDKIVPGNYDGDNKADIAVYRDGVWYILNSSDGSVRIEQWGISEDIPVPSDFDNDGIMNLAVFRPSSGTWYIKTENSFYAVNWGITTDKPVPADYDGDGKTDVAVYRPAEGIWYILNSRNGEFSIKNFGIAEDKPVVADYDSDGKSDIAVFRPSNGVWYIEQSSDNRISYQQFGLSEDVPIVNDFDGDGKNDISVFRQNSGTWFTVLSSNSVNSSIVWGTNRDISVFSPVNN